jgi:uncharacterized protein with LGFP repeats
MWVGPSDGVQARVLPGRPSGTRPSLPEGLRLELVDPGPEPGNAPEPGKPSEPGKAPEPGKPPEPGKASGAEVADPAAAPRRGTDPGTGTAHSQAADAEAAASGALLPALTREATRAEYADYGKYSKYGKYGKWGDYDKWSDHGEYPATKPRVGPRPRIVTRKGWRADEKLRERGHVYGKTVKAAFVHHTAMTNNYSCRRAPSIIRAMYRYHVKSSKWRDIGYNFLVDKCGTIYEGRSGGVAKPVRGAHTYGFNTNTMGIAVLGSFSKHKPPKRALKAIAQLTAWKLGLYGVNPADKTWLRSGGGKFRKGQKVRFHTISGHRDGYVTECPGARLYAKLPKIRKKAARLQGR